MNPGLFSSEVSKPIDRSQKDLSNQKTTKSLLQKIALLIPPFFVFVANRFYPIGLKLSCVLALIGSSLIYLFQKVFPGHTSKKEAWLDKQKEGMKLWPRKQKLTKGDLIQAYVEKMNRPEENEQNLEGKAFEIWLLKTCEAILEQFSVGTKRELGSIQKAIEGLEESEKDAGDKRFEFITKLEKKIDPSGILEENFKELDPLIKCARILVVILKHEKDDLIDAKHALKILEKFFVQDVIMDISTFVVLLSFLKQSREEGRTEEQIDRALKGLKGEHMFAYSVIISDGGMKAVCELVREAMEPSLFTN